MIRDLLRRPMFWVLAVIVFAVLVALAACDKKQPDIPSPHPLPCATWQAPDGTWMEEDNEPVDSDPCDRESSKPSPKPSSKPSVKLSPAKPAAKPTKK